MAAKEIVVTFLEERETKRMVRFQEVPRDSMRPEMLVTGTMYVSKDALQELGIRPGRNRMLTVTFTETPIE